MRRKPKLRPVRAERFVVRLNTGSDCRKLMTMGFTPDGSFWAAAPYIQQGAGLLAELTMDAGVVGPVDMSLAERGKVTVHRVKYSHHRSGVAHFSQTGRVKSEVRRKSTPLASYDGHLLTLHVQGFEGFTEDAEPKADAPWEEDCRKRNVTFGPPPDGTEAVKIVVRCFANRLIKKRIKGPRLGPWTQTQDSEGKLSQGLLVSGPLGTPASSTYMIVGLETIPKLSNESTTLSLIGAFDPPQVSRNPNRSTSFLAMIYPAENYEELLDKIGTVDVVAAP